MKKASQLTWRTSSFCQNGECAEIADDPDVPGGILVRSTRNPDAVARFGSIELLASLARAFPAGAPA